LAFNVLLVDDSETMRAMIRRVIKLSGFEADNIYEASNGREALEVLDKNWVDLVLTDIHMPEMDGLEFLRLLRANPVLARLPVIVVTSEGSEQPLREALALGAKTCLRKPFTPEKVRQVLTRQLERSA
jgi:two-component system chemotaxis response regulator CheY